MSPGAVYTAAGSLVGGVAVIPGAELVEELLFGVAPTDPWSLAGGAALVIGLAGAACWLPAARAARLDPARALRNG